QEAEQKHDAALEKAEEHEGVLVARGVDHVRDRDDRDGRARAEAGGGEAGGEAAAIREPLQRVAHAGAVDGARADAAESSADIEQEERIRDRIEHPGEAAEDAAGDNDDLRAELVD